MYGEKVSITCQFCGVEFLASKALAEKRRFRFCSPKCAAQQRKRSVESSKPVWVCESCGKTFTRKYERPQPPRFCSIQCLGVYKTGVTRPAARPLLTRECRVCKQPFETRAPDRLYCSKKCQRLRSTVAPVTQQTCEYCEELFKPRHSRSRFCSRRCLYASMTGEKSASWKGGRHSTPAGYVKLYRKDHPAADGMGYVPEHRLVIEKSLGRFLERHETVHHINGDRSDNRLENLQLRSGRHGKGKVMICGDCGSHNIITKPITSSGG